MSTSEQGSSPADLDDLTGFSALELAAAIRAKQISPVEVMEATLARMDAINPRLNAIIWRNDDAARAAADAMTRMDAADLPPFHGVPIPIKDLTPVAGWPLTQGSWAVPDTPSEDSELVVEALLGAGFVLTGRTNTPELGFMSATENLRYGITCNPWDLDRSPGGSTGGGAAAVAAGVFAVAHGNDGGGSIRIPASCSGLVGLKVSRGRVPCRVQEREGGLVQGVLSRDVADTAAILDVISTPDQGGWYNAPVPGRRFLDEMGADPGQLRIGLVEEAPFGLPVDPECLDAVRQAGAVLETLGHHVEPAAFGLTDEFNAAHANMALAGLGGPGVDWEKTEPHVRAYLPAGRAITGQAYVESVAQLQRFSRDTVSRWGREFDLLLTPTLTILPPRAGETMAAVHQGDGSLVDANMAFLAVFNVTGQPAISLPTHMSAVGLPVGIQLVGGPWEEVLLIQVAAQLETALPWGHRRPPTA